MCSVYRALGHYCYCADAGISVLIFVDLTKEEVDNELGLSNHGKSVVRRILSDISKVCYVWTLQLKVVA